MFYTQFFFDYPTFSGTCVGGVEILEVDSNILKKLFTLFNLKSSTGSFWKLIVQVYHFWFHERFSMAHLTSNDKSVIDGDDDRLAFVKYNLNLTDNGDMTPVAYYN
ncbi:hypothetical protein T07_12811 [Trichinella nelsoni]|uniref:Uncharacterized protein n=1 Tax=Trichinella nelsoni TaxID=6336 RepID=A0A0V0RWW8_9BILA|nr:hypothetical protein T07_12811 [Trichinella nelsoni]